MDGTKHNAVVDYAYHQAEIEKLNAAISVWKATHDLLKQQIAELKAELSRRGNDYESLRRSHYLVKETVKRTVDLVYARNKKIAELRDEVDKYYKKACARQSNYEELGRTYSRLTAALNDDKRAERVAKDGEDPNWMYSLSAINDYRTEILKEVL